MRQLPFILLNVALVVVALVVYDQVRGEDPAPTRSPTPDAKIEDAIESLQARLSAIESAPPPALPPEGINARLLARIEELERLLDGGAPESLPATSPPDDLANPPLIEEPSAAEVENFRKLALAARKAEREKRVERKVTRATEKLGIALTDEQQEQLVAALAAFEPRRSEIWGAAKARGVAEGTSVDWGVIIRDTSEAIEREFTEQISAFIPGIDAATLSEALSTNGK